MLGIRGEGSSSAKLSCHSAPRKPSGQLLKGGSGRVLESAGELGMGGSRLVWVKTPPAAFLARKIWFASSRLATTRSK